MATITKRRTADGKIRYRVQVRIKQSGSLVHVESRTFSTLATARSWARAREELLSSPEELAKARHAVVTLGDLIDRYLTETAAHRAPGRSKGAALKALKKTDLAARNVLTLRPRHILDHLITRRQGGTAGATALQDLVWVGVVMRYARRVWGIPIDTGVWEDAAASAKSEKVVTRPRKRVRRPSADELRRIEAWFSARKRTAIPMDLVMWLAIYSARRQDELCRIRLADLNEGVGTYWVRDLKHPDGSKGNDKLALLPAPGWAVVRVIKARVPKSDDGRLLPFNPRTVSAYWARACKMLGIKDLHFHDLRHEACSRLAEDGKTIPEIQQVSLHDSWSSLQRYVQVTRQDRVEWSGLAADKAPAAG